MLSFLEKFRKTFLQFDLQKNFIKHIENLQDLSEKFIGDNLSIIDIAFKKLRFIDYRYRPELF